VCVSKANVKNLKERDETTSKMAMQFETMVGEGEFEVKGNFPVHVVVGMPMKLMEMVRGRGWDWKEGEEEKNEEEGGRTTRRGRDKMVGLAKVWLMWSGLSLKLMLSLVCMPILSGSFILTLPQIPMSKKRLEHSCPTSGFFADILSPSHLHHQLRLFHTHSISS